MGPFIGPPLQSAGMFRAEKRFLTSSKKNQRKIYFFGGGGNDLPLSILAQGNKNYNLGKQIATWELLIQENNNLKGLWCPHWSIREK